MLERELAAGSFFRRLPRFGGLISINKARSPAPGPDGARFAMRHDWNSLLAPGDAPPWPRDDRRRFTAWTGEYYPSARLLADYLAAVADSELSSKRVRYSHEVARVSRDLGDEGAGFTVHVRTPGGNPGASGEGARAKWRCGVLIWATNLGTPNPGGIQGGELAIPYDEVPEDKRLYRNKSVAIVGGGNAAYEVAKHIASEAAMIHIYARSPPRLSWQTHYPGDLRGVNQQFLDHYQLKSLDALVISKHPVRIYCGAPYGDAGATLLRMARSSNQAAKWASDGWSSAEVFQAMRAELGPPSASAPGGGVSGSDCGSRGYSVVPECFGLKDCDSAILDAWETSLHEYQPYDLVVRATGWHFDPTAIFDADVRPERTTIPKDKVCKQCRDRACAEIWPLPKTSHPSLSKK